MIRTGLKIGILACGLTLLASAPVSAYFPPPGGITTSVPPDPFVPPTTGGVGEPETPDPTVKPTVSTPEPSAFVPAFLALGLLAGYTTWQRRRNAAANAI